MICFFRLKLLLKLALLKTVSLKAIFLSVKIHTSCFLVRCYIVASVSSTRLACFALLYYVVNIISVACCFAFLLQCCFVWLLFDLTA